MSSLTDLGARQRDVLSGGRAPACLQRDLAQAAAKRADLSRACAWVAETTAITAPKLRDEPLLGSCLAGLTAELKSEPPPEPAKQPSGRRTAVSKQPPETKPVRPQPAKQRMTAPAKPTPEAAEKPREVKRDLLQRLAGKTAVTRPSNQAERHEAGQNLPPPRPPQKRAAQTSPGASSQQAVEPEQEQSWRKSLSRRACRRISQINNQSNAAPAFPEMEGRREMSDNLHDGQAHASVRQTFAQGAEQGITNGQNAFEAAWQQRLSGQSAAADILKALSQPDRSEAHNRAGQKTRSGEKPALQTSDWASHAAGSQTETGVQADRLSSKAQPMAQRRPLPAQDQPSEPSAAFNQTATAWPTSQMGNDRQRIGTAGHDTQFSPPRTVPAMPPLKPPQRPFAAQPPVATAVAQQNARREAASAADGLDDLASKIKQILDEESRRHGIDV